jgi:ElaB/YqjD/DUF883 family membrane-anchored ribosome-binding protein
MSELHVEEERRDAEPMIVERVRAADQKIVAFVRERPIAALAAAVAIGYVVGRVFSRIA